MKKKIVFLTITILSILCLFNVCFAGSCFNNVTYTNYSWDDVTPELIYELGSGDINFNDYYFVYGARNYSSYQSKDFWFFPKLYNDSSTITDAYYTSNQIRLPNFNDSNSYGTCPHVQFIYKENTFQDLKFGGDYLPRDSYTYTYISMLDPSGSSGNQIIDYAVNFDFFIPDSYELNYTRTTTSSFFTLTPEGGVEIQSVILPEIVEQVENKNQVLAEIVHLLPVILLVVVGLIALRKALQTLVIFLHRS